MELWELHLIMFFSCLLVFVLAVLAIRRFFLGRRHLKSEFQGPRRKGDGPIIRSAKQTAQGAAATDAVAIAEAFESSSAALQATESDVAVKSQHESSSAPQKAEHEHVAALRRVPQLSVVTDQELARLAQHVRLVAVTAGETLFRAGEPANTAYIIKNGSVALSGGFDDGVDEIGSRQLATGECFGGEALELTETYSNSAIALTSSQMWILERAKVAIALSSAHELAKRSSFQNVSLKSVSTAALVASSIPRNSLPGMQPVVLPGVSYAAPSLIPQQQAPLSLLSSYAIPLPSSSATLPPPAHHASSQYSESVASASISASASATAGSAARVPKSLLKKHSSLFDSDASAV